MSSTVMNDEESVGLALLTSTKRLSPDDFMRLLAVEDPDRLMPRFWANIDCGAPMIVDAATLTFLGYAGTVRIQKHNFRMMLNSENIPYTTVSAVDVRKWPEIKQEINEAIPAVAKKLQWVVLSGSNFKRAYLFAQTPRSRIVAEFYIELEIAWHQYARYVTLPVSKKGKSSRILTAVGHSEARCKRADSCCET